ncbi:MAG: hypothetical protein E7458_05370 [Ruminococcaceae bacterium]|nr:hypothetical protein [Oscillospiraceae bacterium]
MRRKTRYEMSAGYKFFLTFCITLSVLTVLSVLFVSFVYRPEIGENFLHNVQDSLPVAGGSDRGTEPDVSGKDRRSGVHTVLVAGTDYDGTRTDTLLAVTIDTKADTINVLSIPRDTRSYMENGAVHKINAAHNKGSDRMMTEVANTIGFMPDHYVVLDYGDFKEIIEAIGGVVVDVPMDMYYIADDMVIDLKKGIQTLNGEEALMFMRYREGYADADLGRIRAQQTLFLSLAKSLMSADTLLHIPDLVRIFYEDLETDYKLSELIWLGVRCVGMDFSGFTVDRLPGHISGADYVVDPEDALKLINEKYNPYHKPITTLNTAQ